MPRYGSLIKINPSVADKIVNFQNAIIEEARWENVSNRHLPIRSKAVLISLSIKPGYNK